MARKARRNKTHKPRADRNPPSAIPNKDALTMLRDWLLPNEGIFSGLKRHGNTKWTPIYLAWLGLCWGWAESRNLTDAFAHALTCCQDLSATVPLSSYVGFIKALTGWRPKVMPLLRVLVQQRMEELGGEFWRIDGWVPIAFDGSRSSAPRTPSNEAALCAPNYGKGKTAKYRKKKSQGMRRTNNEKNKPQPQEPQIWITMMWHMGLRLPWNWRLGPSNSSERDHVMEMVRADQVPENTLFCGDAGFVGYSLWSGILEHGSDFLVRVGANVSLLYEKADCTIEKPGKETPVLCWPKSASKAHEAPLRLRLVRVRLSKKTYAWMLTSVLDAEKLSGASILQLYKKRWGIEVEFRGLKQTLNRGVLRSRNAEYLLTELDWSILSMAVAELFALKVQLAEGSTAAGEPPDPGKRSLAKTMRALRAALANLDAVPHKGRDLWSQLKVAVTDGYIRKRSKKARYRPSNPDKKPLGDPKVRVMTKKEREELERQEQQIAA